MISQLLKRFFFILSFFLLHGVWRCVFFLELIIIISVFILFQLIHVSNAFYCVKDICLILGH